jgi:protocatechuate 3,4-dioxygenase beta subunit
MCTYGYMQGVMIWVNTDNFANVTKLAKRLENEIERKGLKRIRAYVVYMNPANRTKEEVASFLESFAQDAGLRKVAVTYVPSPSDPKTSKLYDINPDPAVKNTVIVYKNRKTIDKQVNFVATAEAMEKLIRAVEAAELSNKGSSH